MVPFSLMSLSLLVTASQPPSLCDAAWSQKGAPRRLAADCAIAGTIAKEIARLFSPQHEESTAAELRNISQIEHSRHRAPASFLINLFAGLAAYTFQPKKPRLKLPLALRATGSETALIEVGHNLYRVDVDVGLMEAVEKHDAVCPALSSATAMLAVALKNGASLIATGYSPSV